MLKVRLGEIARRIPDGATVADVGTDHGLLALAVADRVKRVYATDVSADSLAKLKAALAENPVPNIVPVVTDGLTGLEEEPIDTVVIAGMGAVTIEGILAAATLPYLEKLILCPHVGVEKLRPALGRMGYRIADETMIEEDGKFYPILEVVRGTETFTEREALYGKFLPREKSAVFLRFLAQEKRMFEQVLEADLPAARRAEVIKRLTWIEEMEEVCETP